MAEEILTYCTVHPDKETALRCNKCGRLMCAECAVSTPVGYRCKQCVRQHDDKFFNASQNDYVIVAAICAVLSGIAAAIVNQIGIPLLFMFFIGIPLGGGIAELALRATQRRRGRQSALVGVVAVMVGAVLGVLAQITLIIGVIPPLDIVWRVLISDFRLVVFVGVIAFFVYNRFKMRV